MVVFPLSFARRALDFESRAKTPLQRCVRDMERQLWNRQGDVDTVYDQHGFSVSGIKFHQTPNIQWNRIPPLESTPSDIKLTLESTPLNMKIA